MANESGVVEAMDVQAASYRSSAAEAEYEAALERKRPSMMLRPRLSIDGNRWCALFGENLQDGVAGFGPSPAEAYADFDREWVAPLPPTVSQVEG